MSRFRISLGQGSCKNITGATQLEQTICDQIKSRFDNINALDIGQIRQLASERFETSLYENREIRIITYTDQIDSNRILVVVQAFYPTWESPNYFSFFRVGKMYAEGFVIEPDGTIQDAPEQLLFAYR